MRVLHVIPGVGPAHGGPSLAVKLMASVCAAKGATVTVATTNANLREALDVPLAQPVAEQGASYIYFARDLHFWTVSRALAAWVEQHVREFDVVHIHALFSYATVAAARSARRAGVPYVVRPLGTLARYGMSRRALLKQFSFRLFDKRVLRKAAAVHFTSEAEREESARLGDWRSVVIPLGIDVAAYSDARSAGEGELRLLFMSRIDPKKRLDLVFHALAALPDMPVRLTIAGDGDADYVASLHVLAVQLGIEARVQWAGYVVGQRKTELLRDADVFVLPSMNENFGIAVVEALASGLPVIISPEVAIHCEVQSAGAGVVCEAEPDALASAIRGVADWNVRARMGAHGRELAEEAFSIAVMGEALMALYQRLAS